ncbi:gag-asp_proteas domain-containing protein [Gossypium australe]|uniref:Gag-asp_proteas domain-containing protein n=1 Tax=Gossypium australe TaxID=47621 RepID=A0A5B6WTS6_9ROSI|nr:gag-asp_proteas domain-containing protein [Gossypium australe]
MARSKKIKSGVQVNLNASCSVINTRQIPQKIKDTGSFIILIEIGYIHFSKALCDLGYSKMCLLKCSVKVLNFITRIDFVILDFDEDREILILLG